MTHIKYIMLVMLVISITGCGTSLLFVKKYEEPKGETTELTFSAPWITGTDTFDFNKNITLTIWNYKDPENKELLGVIILTADKKSTTVRISTGHALAMHTGYSWVNAGKLTTCGNNFIFTPEQDLRYELLFMYPVPVKDGNAGCTSHVWGKKPGSENKFKVMTTHMNKL